MDGILNSTTRNSADIHPLVSWRSILGGLAAAVLAYWIFVTLGVALGSTSLTDGMETSPITFGTVLGLWAIVSAGLALFVGSYFAARISRYPARLIGSAQGLIITSLFFTILSMKALVGAGAAGKALSTVAGTAATGVSATANMAEDSDVPYVIQDIVQETFAGANLRSSPETVVRGVAVRLLQGDPERAKNYLAREARMTPTEAQNRINQVRGKLEANLAAAAEKTAVAVSTAAWAWFAMMVVGLVAAMGGGVLGSVSNEKNPLSEEELTPGLHISRPAA
jgi:hypothetical protein